MNASAALPSKLFTNRPVQSGDFPSACWTVENPLSLSLSRSLALNTRTAVFIASVEVISPSSVANEKEIHKKNPFKTPCGLFKDPKLPMSLK